MPLAQVAIDGLKEIAAYVDGVGPYKMYIEANLS